MALQLIDSDAPAIDGVTSDGRRRGVARTVGSAYGARTSETPNLRELPDLAPGRVTSLGSWSDAATAADLTSALGEPYASALRPTFEWYACRAAFFHNDAHFNDVLFGIWCIAGPVADVVFPRLGRRLDASPGRLVVFDPFEVHGVLAPGRTLYDARDYEAAEPSVFIGFELALTAGVAAAFRLPAAAGGRALSSRTRIDATTGAFE